MSGVEAEELFISLLIRDAWYAETYILLFIPDGEINAGSMEKPSLGIAEMSIVFGNRYRSKYNEIDKGLLDAEDLFYKGKYKESLDVALKAVSIVDDKIYRKLLGVYDE